MTMVRILGCPIATALGLLIAGSSPAHLGAAGRTAKLLETYELPPYSLENFGYSAGELAIAAGNGLATSDYPAIGSGLQNLNGNHYLSVTDRGPSPDRPDGAKAFPLPQFTPTIVLFRTAGGQIHPEAFLPILNNLGQGVTGVPNGPSDDAPGYPSMTGDVPLPFNTDALDPEEIHALPGGGFILADEYSPSVVVVSPNGEVLRRYIPEGKTLDNANYPVVNALPEVLKERRANRGFEGIAVSPDGNTAITLTQSPLGSSAAGSPYRDSLLLRIIRMDISDPLNLEVTGQFVFYMSPLSEYPAGNAARDLKISAAVYVSQTRLLLLERTDRAGAGGVKLVMVDLSEATNVQGHPAATALPLVLEDVATDLADFGIVPATTEVVLDLNTELPQITDYKLEGLAILNRNIVAFSNDNDFGMVPPATPSKVYRIRLSQPLW